MKYKEGDRGNLREILENLVKDWSISVRVSCFWESIELPGVTFEEVLPLDECIYGKPDIDNKKIDYEVEILSMRYYEEDKEMLLRVDLIGTWDNMYI